MTLDRQKMIDRCLDGFFLALNDKDMDRLRQSFTPDCQMIIPSSDLLYADADAIVVHLEDFADTFAIIDFHDFLIVPDPEGQRVAATFTVTITDPQGEVTEMRNANFFDITDDYKISRVLIIATKPLDKGFQVGRS